MAVLLLLSLSQGFFNLLYCPAWEEAGCPQEMGRGKHEGSKPKLAKEKNPMLYGVILNDKSNWSWLEGCCCLRTAWASVEWHCILCPLLLVLFHCHWRVSFPVFPSSPFLFSFPFPFPFVFVAFFHPFSPPIFSLLNCLYLYPWVLANFNFLPHTPANVWSEQRPVLC